MDLKRVKKYERYQENDLDNLSESLLYPRKFFRALN